VPTTLFLIVFDNSFASLKEHPIKPIRQPFDRDRFNRYVFDNIVHYLKILLSDPIRSTPNRSIFERVEYIQPNRRTSSKAIDMIVQNFQPVSVSDAINKTDIQINSLKDGSTFFLRMTFSIFVFEFIEKEFLSEF